MLRLLPWRNSIGRWKGATTSGPQWPIFAIPDRSNRMYYLQRRCSDSSSEDKRIARLAEVRNKLELIIAKQRNGPTGSLEIFFDAASNAARDLDRRR
jgi:hypothetical protein